MSEERKEIESVEGNGAGTTEELGNRLYETVKQRSLAETLAMEEGLAIATDKIDYLVKYISKLNERTTMLEAQVLGISKSMDAAVGAIRTTMEWQRDILSNKPLIAGLIKVALEYWASTQAQAQGAGAYSYETHFSEAPVNDIGTYKLEIVDAPSDNPEAGLQGYFHTSDGNGNWTLLAGDEANQVELLRSILTKAIAAGYGAGAVLYVTLKPMGQQQQKIDVSKLQASFVQQSSDPAINKLTISADENGAPVYKIETRGTPDSNGEPTWVGADLSNPANMEVFEKVVLPALGSINPPPEMGSVLYFLLQQAKESSGVVQGDPDATRPEESSGIHNQMPQVSAIVQGEASEIQDTVSSAPEETGSANSANDVPPEQPAANDSSPDLQAPNAEPAPTATPVTPEPEPAPVEATAAPVTPEPAPVAAADPAPTQAPAFVSPLPPSGTETAS